MQKKIIVGNVDITRLALRQLPSFFNNVEITGAFWCHTNYLLSLEGGPTRVKKAYICSYNFLKTLSGAPTEVGTLGAKGGDFICSHNLIKSLEGAPTIVHGNFSCKENPKLVSLTGIPQVVYGDFSCQRTKGKFTEEQIRSVCDVKGRVFTGDE